MLLAILAQAESLLVDIHLTADQVDVLNIAHALHLHAWLIQWVALINLQAPMYFRRL